MSVDNLPCAVKLELTLVKLRQEQQRNERLQKRIEKVRRFAQEVLNRTQPILCQRSGVPRGKWSFARGADGTAKGVLRVLGGQ